MTTNELPLTLDTRALARLMSISRRSVERMRAGGAFPKPLPGLRRPRWSTHVVLDWLRANGERPNYVEDRT